MHEVVDACQRLQRLLDGWSNNKLIPVATTDLRIVLQALDELAGTGPIPQEEIDAMKAWVPKILARSEKLAALRKELLMAPMKDNYTFSRDELIALVGPL